MKFTGKVVQRSVAVGSKSQHEAVMLDAASASYVLRRQGGNPFHDPQLVEMVGKQIECTGTLHGETLIVTSWVESSG